MKICTLDGKVSSNPHIKEISVYQNQNGSIEIVVKMLATERTINLEPDDPKTQHMRVSEVMHDFGFPPMLWCE